jgi:beta-glucosidase
MNHQHTFPPNFVWGAATSAPQIEGAAFEDGKGESIWDRFCRRPGAVANGDTLDAGCDHYHRFAADCALLRELGLRHYRFSIAWPRVFPLGTGAVNQPGLDFYARLIDALLENGVTPWATLFHWDLPQALEDQGGWRVRATADAFGVFAELVARRLGDRVKNWMTLNELPSFIGLGYGPGGTHAPGAHESPQILNQCYHNALLAHGRAAQALRAQGGKGVRIGLAHNATVPVPVTENEADIAAARTQFERGAAQIMGPIFQGCYPPSFVATAGPHMPDIEANDLEQISQPLDFWGLNVYGGAYVRAGQDGLVEELPFSKGYPHANVDWLNITPQAAYWAVRHSTDIFGAKEIYITENGLCQDDEPDAKGEVLDLGRREFYRNYLIQVHRALEDGYRVGGYFAWSLLDNFEWAYGYEKRFGIVHVDFQTQRRTPKLSARWLAQVVRANQIL